MSERGFFSASNDIKTLDGNIFSGFPWLTTHLLPKLHGAIPGAQLGCTLYLWAKRINLHQSSGLGLDQCMLMLKRPRPILGILI